MKAIILNAGSSERLQDLTKDKPKCLLDIQGNTLLEIQINVLYNCGIDDITVVKGYKGNQIQIPGIKYYENKDYKNTGALYSLFCAEEELNDEILILYGDIIFEEETIKRILESKKDISIGVMTNIDDCLCHRKNVNYSELEMLSFDAENMVDIIGKNLDSNCKNKGLFTGIIKCSSKGSEILKRNYKAVANGDNKILHLKNVNVEKAWITDLLNDMAHIGVPLSCIIIEKGWLEIDTVEDYERAINDNSFIKGLVKVKTDWNERAKTYNNITWVNKDETLDEMARFAGSLECKNILDIGTGTGKVLKKLKQISPNSNFYGIDISKEMMSKIDANLGFNLSVGNVEDLSIFDNNFFDIVTARMVLHHSSDLEKALEEVYRVLKPGGKFIICEGNPPNRYCLKFYEEMFKFKEERHTFLQDDITNLMINANFSDISCKTIVLKDMSLNNWLENAGVPYRNLDIIRKLHFESDMLVKKAYNMKFIEDDILMNWKFSVVCGSK